MLMQEINGKSPNNPFDFGRMLITKGSGLIRKSSKSNGGPDLMEILAIKGVV